MSLDDVKERFVEEFKLRGDDDKYIDKIEEVEILQIAVRQGVSAESARAALGQVCDARAYVLESRVLGEVKELIETFAGKDGKIGEKDFRDAVATLKKHCQGRRDDGQCKRMVVEVIEANCYRVKEGLFNRWYGKVKKEIGMA
jgi:hypothetical protein